MGRPIIKFIAAFVAALLVASSASAHAQSARAFDARAFEARTTRSASSALQKAARVWGTAKVIQGGATTAGATTAGATTASVTTASETTVSATLARATTASATHAGTATGFSCATYTSQAAVAGFALTQAAVLVAVGVTLHLHVSRVGSIATYGNPYGIPAQDIAFTLQRDIRARRARPSIPDPYPIPEPAPVPAPGDQKPDESRPGRLYATYTRYNRNTGLYYSGRTSAVIDLNKDWDAQAQVIVQTRNRAAKAEASKRGFDNALLDTYAVGVAVDYRQRYRDTAYLSIRGREQQLIDFHGARRARARGIKNFRGGAWSDTSSKAERLTENTIRGVARDNPLGQIFHATANLAFGEIAPYTGIVRF